MLSSDFLLLRETHFALWCPAPDIKDPVLVIGTFAAGNQNTLADRHEIPFSKAGPAAPGLWIIAAATSRLADGIYHYWFQVANTNTAEPALAPILCTDPFATTVDWRLLSPSLPAGFNNDTDLQPASVIRLQNERLHAVDPGGESATFAAEPTPDTLPGVAGSSSTSKCQAIRQSLPTPAATWSFDQGSRGRQRHRQADLAERHGGHFAPGFRGHATLATSMASFRVALTI